MKTYIWAVALNNPMNTTGETLDLYFVDKPTKEQVVKLVEDDLSSQVNKKVTLTETQGHFYSDINNVEVYIKKVPESGIKGR